MSLPEEVVEHTIKYKEDPFWSQDFGVLFRKDRLVEFIPTYDMSLEERLNAITRMCVYASLILLAYKGKTWTLYIGILGMAFTLFLFKAQPEVKEPPKYPTNETPKTDDPNPFIPSEQPKCIPPTENNPFMNVMLNEYVDNPTRPSACEYSEVRGELENNFYNNLYQDVDEVLWNKNNSQRQFFTMPWTTIPNEQGQFARWLYKVGGVCKQDQSACLRYEDLRANRGIVGDSEYLV